MLRPLPHSNILSYFTIIMHHLFNLVDNKEVGHVVGRAKIIPAVVVEHVSKILRTQLYTHVIVLKATAATIVIRVSCLRCLRLVTHLTCFLNNFLLSTILMCYETCLCYSIIHSKQYRFNKRNPSVQSPCNPRKTLAGFTWGCMVIVLKGSF